MKRASTRAEEAEQRRRDRIAREKALRRESADSASLTLNEFQKTCVTFALYPGQGGLLGLAYAALGLNGEAGETAEQVKKTWRDDAVETGSYQMTDERRQKIIKELGDTLWYAAQIATEIGTTLGEVAQINMDKLAARRDANLIHGEGSDR